MSMYIDIAIVLVLFIQALLGKTVSELISLCYGFYNISTPLSIMFPELDTWLCYRGMHCGWAPYHLLITALCPVVVLSDSLHLL